MGIRLPNRLLHCTSIEFRRQVVRAAESFGIVAALGVSTLMMPTIINAQELVSTTVAARVTNGLRLHVVNNSDAPVPYAEVTVKLGERKTIGRTDSVGVFRIDGLAPGDWQASVRRIGYNEAVIDVHIANGENVYTVTVDPASTALDKVEVVEKINVSARLEDFERRKARGEPNAVITREQIEKRNPTYLSQMMRGLPGLNIADEFGVRIPVASRGNVPKFPTMQACPMRVGVDGVMRPPLSSLDDVVPKDVHGVEIYYGPARLPLQLANFRTDNWCGLVMIWTRAR